MAKIEDQHVAEAIGIAVSAGVGVLDSGIQYGEIVFEVPRGPRQGRRYKKRVYFNTQKNAEDAVRDLRTSGWKGKKFSAVLDMRGAPEVRLTIHNELEQRRPDGQEPKRFPRVAFVNKMTQLEIRNNLADEDLDALTRDFSDLLGEDPPPMPDDAEESGDWPAQDPDGAASVEQAP